MRPTIENSLVLIPARAGSKGVPNKNAKPFSGGNSLTERAIAVALGVFPGEKVVLSTDDLNLIQQGNQAGISVIERSPELASDTAGMLEVMLDAVDQQTIEPTFLILLQPTSPFRTVEHLTRALELFQENDQALVAVNEPKGHPFYTLFQQEGDFIHKFEQNAVVRRQDLPPMYDVNGLLYIFNVAELRKASWVAFDRIRPMVVSQWEAIDIDTPEDWWLAETLMKGMK